MCLYVFFAVLPIGIGNLASLEELTGVLVDGSSVTEKELGQLIELRVLGLIWNVKDESMCNSLVASLCNLWKMQTLRIFGDSAGPRGARFDVSWDGFVPTPQLQALLFDRCTTTLPRWVNSSSLPLLSSMDITVDRVRPEVDIHILGKLPALRYLRMSTSKHQHTCVKTFVVGANAFPCLRECTFWRFLTVPSMFPRGAMPRLEVLVFSAQASDIGGGDLDVTMGHLRSLQEVTVFLWLEEGSSSVKCKEEADVVLRQAADTHHIRPILRTFIDHYYLP